MFSLSDCVPVVPDFSFFLFQSFSLYSIFYSVFFCVPFVILPVYYFLDIFLSFESFCPFIVLLSGNNLSVSFRLFTLRFLHSLHLLSSSISSPIVYLFLCVCEYLFMPALE